MFVRAALQLALLALCFGQSVAARAAQSITIQGRVQDSSGDPVVGASTQFRVKILTPTPARCVLYDETQTVDLTNTNGLFSINLNNGAGTVNAPTTYSLEQALSNRVGFGVDASYCASGSGTITYSPAYTDNRKVIISFRDPGSMASFELIPEMDLNPIPYAIESRVIGGYPASSLLRVENSGSPGTAAALSSANFTELQALLAGTSTAYMSADGSSTTGARLPSYSGNPLSPAAGSIWFDSTGSGALKYKDSSGAVQTVGSGGGGGTITSITAGGALTGGGSSGAVTVSLPTTGVTGFGSAVGSASAVPVITYDSYGRLTSVTTAAISGTLPSGTNGEFLKYSGGAWASAAVRMSDIKNATGAAALFGSTTCAASETFYWDSGTDQFKCQSIALGAPAGAVAATYTKVTVAADGRVNGGSATIGNSDIADLAWGKLTSVPSLVANGGSASSIIANSSGSKPAGQVAGRIYVDVSNQKISYDNGAAWVDVSGSAAATPSVSVSAPITSTSGTIGITQASGSTDGYLSSANFTAFTNKLSKALTSAHIFVGNGSGDATDVAVSGDLSLANTGAFSVDRVKGTAVTAAATAAGQVLRYNGTTGYAPTLLSLADIRSNVTGSSTFTTTCTASQTLTWNSGNDTLSCQDISLAAATQLSGIVPVANGGTGTSNGSITGTGALTFTAGGSNQNVSLAPSGTGYTLLGGKVGIGTTAPNSALSIAVPEVSSGRESLMTFRMNGDANTVGGIGNLTSANGAFGPMFFGYRPGNFDRMVTSFRGFTDSAGDVAGTENALVDISGVITDNNSDPINGNQWVPSNRNIFSVSSWDGPLMSVSPTGRVGIGSFTPATSLDLSQKKDAVSLPRGTTAEAPAASRAGMIRWNTSNSALEVSNGSTWVSVLAGNAYSFSTGTTGNAPNWSNTGNAYSLNIPLASSGAGVTAGLLSNAEYADLAAKASPTFTGTPAAPTAAADTNTTQLATTAFVLGQASSATPLINSGAGAVGSSLKYARGDHVHPTDTSRAPAAGSTSITTLGTITSGTWNGSAIPAAYGGTGLSSIGSNGQVLTVVSGAPAWQSPPSGSGAPTVTFLANRSNVDQSVAANTSVKTLWTNVVFDTNSGFNTGSSRYIPNVAGKYLFIASLRCGKAGQAIGVQYCGSTINKNGVIVADHLNRGPNYDIHAVTTAIVDMNGTTDYVETTSYSDAAVVDGSSSSTYFTGTLLSGATVSSSGSGSTNYLPQWITSTALGNSPIAVNGTNVGIGTASPAQKLSVAGTIESTTGGIKFPDGSVQATAAGGLNNCGLTASVSSSALTVTLVAADGSALSTTNTCSLIFRSASLASGTSNTRVVSAPISITVPSGTTLGSIASDPSPVNIYAVDNAGTVTLGASLTAGYSKYNLYNTNAISGGTSPTTLYTASALTSVPTSYLGYAVAAQSTAGTWAAAPTEVTYTGAKPGRVGLPEVRSTGTVHQAATDGTLWTGGNGTYYNLQVGVTSGTLTSMVSYSEANGATNANGTQHTAPVHRNQFYRVVTSGGANPSVYWVPIAD